MSQYIHTFLETAPAILDSIREAGSREHWDELKSAAHSLKPQAEFIGLLEMKEALEEMEQFAKQNPTKSEFAVKMNGLGHLFENGSNRLIQTLLTLA